MIHESTLTLFICNFPSYFSTSFSPSPHWLPFSHGFSGAHFLHLCPSIHLPFLFIPVCICLPAAHRPHSQSVRSLLALGNETSPLLVLSSSLSQLWQDESVCVSDQFLHGSSKMQHRESLGTGHKHIRILICCSETYKREQSNTELQAEMMVVEVRLQWTRNYRYPNMIRKKSV